MPSTANLTSKVWFGSRKSDAQGAALSGIRKEWLSFFGL
jgi:hypothetical protein